MVRRVVLSVVVILGLTVGAAHGQNYLTNPDFDTDLTGWTCVGPGTSVWDAHDVDGSATSGSVRIDNDATSLNETKVWCAQCVPVDAYTPLQLTSAVYIADDPGFGLDGSARIQVLFYSDAGCSALLGWSPVGILHAFPATADAWWSISTGWAVAPHGTTHAEAYLLSWVNKDGPPMRMYYDGAVLFEAVKIFEDHFESSDLTLWSTVFP